jgi:hypothetical protein
MDKGKRDADLTQVGHVAGSADETELDQPVHMFARAMRFEQKLFGKSADQLLAARRAYSE